MIKILDISNKEEWNKYLCMIPNHNKDIYFTPEYYKAYQENGDGKAICFVFEENSNIAMYPFLINNIPPNYGFKGYKDIQSVYGYNGIIHNDINDIENFKEHFFNSFYEYCQNEKIIAEFCRFHPLIRTEEFSKGFIDILEDRNTVVLDLSQDKQDIWDKSYSSINRNMIRKAVKNNIHISVSQKEEDFQSFFDIYNGTMKNVNADNYYFFSDKYFSVFLNELKNKSKLLLAKIDDEIISGMLLIYSDNYAHYHLSGRKKEYSNLASNNLLLDTAIKIAKDMKCKYFHFGGGTSSDMKDPLFKFKSGFSKENGLFYIGKKIHNQEIYDQIISIWEKNNPNKIDKRLLKYRN